MTIPRRPFCVHRRQTAPVAAFILRNGINLRRDRIVGAMEMKQLMQIHPLYPLVLKTQVNTSDCCEDAARILAAYVPFTKIDHFLAAWLELQLLQSQLNLSERFRAKREAQNLQLREILIQGKTGKTRLAILQNTAQLLEDCSGTRKRKRDTDVNVLEPLAGTCVQAHRLDVSAWANDFRHRVYSNIYHDANIGTADLQFNRPALRSF